MSASSIKVNRYETIRFTFQDGFCHAKSMRKNILLIVSAVAGLAIFYIFFEMLVPAQSGNKCIEVNIPKGATFGRAADILSEMRLIRDKKLFVLFGRLTGSDRKIRAGYYAIWSSMSPLEIIRALRKGRIIEYEVRIIEGDSIYEIAKKFSESHIASEEDVMRLAFDREFLASNKIVAPSIEGFVFPDTYIIPKGVPPDEALSGMISRMSEKFTPQMAERAQQLGMTKIEVLTLASIIEKEAASEAERPLVSAVYHNRLRKNMPLQADPTSIYGYKSSQEKITKADLLRKTPYNTYIIKGLPPGPIASPGVRSITAALYPAGVRYIYFVSNNDGTHTFSETLDQHNRAVKNYREKKRLKEEEG